MNKQEAIRILHKNITIAEKHITEEASETDLRFLEAMKMAKDCLRSVAVAELALEAL